MPRVKLSYSQIKVIREVLEAAPHLKQLHFTTDGTYYVNAYPFTKEGETEEKMYGRVGLLHNAANKSQAIVDQFLIAKTFSRDEILADGFNGAFDEPAVQLEESPEGAPAPIVEDPAGPEATNTGGESTGTSDSSAGHPATESPAPEAAPQPETEVGTPAPTPAVEQTPETQQDPAAQAAPTEIHQSQQN